MKSPVQSNRNGFTLMEMLVTITIIAVAATVVAPALQDDGRLRLMAASSVLSSDIELAQVMTISYPNEPVVVRFDPSSRKYWLAYASAPDTPITREGDGSPYEVTFGQGRAASAADVDIALSELSDNTLSFNAQGGLTNFTSTPAIQLSRTGGAITLSIAPTTGTVTETVGTTSGESSAIASE